MPISRGGEEAGRYVPKARKKFKSTKKNCLIAHFDLNIKGLNIKTEEGET